MARIRTIKPEFWTSDQVMSVSRDARLLFIGMWNFADDGGNQPANTKTIKALVFPGDDLTEGQIYDLVEELLGVGLLETYEADCRWYWNIPTWKKHQRIDQPTYRHPGVDGRVAQNLSRRRSGSSSVQGVFVEQSQNAQQVFDAGKKRNGKEGNGKEITDSSESDVDQAAPALPNCPHEKIIELYAQYLPDLPQPRSWEGQRAKDMRACWRWTLTQKNSKGETLNESQALNLFGKFFEMVAQSDFLTGREGGWSGCNLAWLMKKSNFLKVIEGNYQGRGQR